MENPRQSHRTLGLVVGIAAIALLAGGAATWWTRQTPERETEITDNPSPSSTVSPATPAVPTPSASSQQTQQNAPSEQTVRAYWLKDTGTAFELVPISLSVKTDGTEPEAILKATFDRLFETPEQNGSFSTIPSDTTLQDLSVREDGIHVNLSEAFTSGGGSASMTGRLGQVVYTATSLDPKAPVWLSVNDEPLRLLGGEGLEVPQPITRQTFDTDFPL
ncbi:MAG: GerMN domain-containing protein [Cyanobacteria bacterium SID2]|nr:GerMN domain-containing protein [Cyanobacteria bacterium SID2]